MLLAAKQSRRETVVRRKCCGDTTQGKNFMIFFSWGFISSENLAPPKRSSWIRPWLETNHGIDNSNFQIVFQTSSFDTKISESILIHKFKPSLNNRESSIKLSILD